jgi:CRP-like cAMP-binding protein
MLLRIDTSRLFQLLNLVKKARIAAQGDLSMDWLKPFMNWRSYRQGDVLFRKGDQANEMYLTVTGRNMRFTVASSTCCCMKRWWSGSGRKRSG